METMNIYVISNCWWHDGSTVIGAATDRAGAEAIGDRYGEDDPPIATWAPWKEDVSPAYGSCTWRRDALLADGTIHPSLSQEIVCVPLAGSTAPVTSGSPIYGQEIAEIGRQFGAP